MAKMKDINLLPEWYTSGKRSERDLRGYYVFLSGVLVAIAVWNFAAGNSLSRAKAALASSESQYIQSQTVIEQSRQLEIKITELREKADLIDSIDSKIDIADVVSELSFLVDSAVVLSEVSFEAEKFTEIKGKKVNVSGIRVANKVNKKSGDGHLGSVRFRIVLRGIADETGDVSKLMRRMDESEYFHAVSLSFSRNRKIKVTTNQGDEQREVSEFEITCYLANYFTEEVK